MVHGVYVTFQIEIVLCRRQLGYDLYSLDIRICHKYRRQYHILQALSPQCGTVCIRTASQGGCTIIYRLNFCSKSRGWFLVENKTINYMFQQSRSGYFIQHCEHVLHVCSAIPLHEMQYNYYG